MDQGVDLTHKASRLADLERLIVRAFIEWQPDQLAKHLAEFSAVKADIRSALLGRPIVNVPGLENSAVRRIIQTIADGQPLPVEQALAGTDLSGIMNPEITESGLDELGRKALYTWFSHFEYAEGLIEAGSLVISCGALPANLASFVDEARQYFAFQQYNAVCALCRTMLEISVKDLAAAHGILRSGDRRVAKLPRDEPELWELIGQLAAIEAFRPLRGQLHEIRRQTNRIIHGHRAVGKAEARATLQRTLASIRALYEAEERLEGGRPTGRGA